MTEITYHNDNRRFMIDFKGHAEYAEHGKDIVCAGISAYSSELLIAGIKAKHKGTIRRFEYHAEEGNFHIEWQYTNLSFLYDTVELVLECLKMLQQDYADNIRIVKN